MDRAFGSHDFLGAVTAALDPQSALAGGHGDFRKREAQIAMAKAVAQAIETRGALVVEAGTGVGKTFAYLVPVLLSGRRALISTATKSLQDQLYGRDLPRVREALGLPLRTALLKGRESYLCLHRMKQARQDIDSPATTSIRTLARVERWSHTTSTGDLSEVEGLEERSPLLPQITSTRDNCLGAQCCDFQQCHVVRARRDAMAADIVVVNHHLFFADVMLRDTGVAELLPTVDIAVFDEAHQLVDTGVQFLGLTLSSAQALDLARDLLAAGLAHARGLAPWPDVVQGIDRAARHLRLAFGDRTSSRSRWPGESDAPAFFVALHDLAQSCQLACTTLSTFNETDPVFSLLAARTKEFERRAQHLLEPAAAARVRWVDVTAHHVRLIETPLDIAAALTLQRERALKTWVFTSATLGEDEKLTWFTEPTGLHDAQTLKLGSPYDHAEHARLWVCGDAPKPDDPGHAGYVASVAARCANALRGRTIVLTTTLRALSRITEALRVELQTGLSGLQVVMQGEQPKRVLLDRLRDQPGTVLVASQSFWEGIDVPGDALQCVIIDKLPFPPPNDPLIEARAKQIEEGGGSAFNACFVAEAAMALKQGAGRLIRSETDRGLLVICDPRMARMPYGKRLQRALPPMTRVEGWAEAQEWLLNIAPARQSAW